MPLQASTELPCADGQFIEHHRTWGNRREVHRSVAANARLSNSFQRAGWPDTRWRRTSSHPSTSGLTGAR